MKILFASSIFPGAIEKIKEEHEVICAFNAKEEELKKQIKDCEVLVFRSGVQISAEVMECAPTLKLLIRAGSGIDNVDVGYVRRKGLRLVRIPGPGAKAVAEMSFALLLALARNVLEADRLTRQGIWAKHELTGFLLTGKTLGIIGAGNIGSRVGQLGVAWGLEVVGCVEFPNPAVASKLWEKGIRLADIDEVLAKADFVSIHVPLKDSSRNLINAEAFAKMKPGAFLVNLARGGVVDESALYKALKEGRLLGAALDVHSTEGNGTISPLAEFNNVILTPHIGAGTFDSQREIGDIVIETLNSYVLEQASPDYLGTQISTEAVFVSR
ncbi:MAG: hydroxyacid dehydrogenase [Anaerolineales bacterium]